MSDYQRNGGDKGDKTEIFQLFQIDWADEDSRKMLQERVFALFASLDEEERVFVEKVIQKLLKNVDRNGVSINMTNPIVPAAMLRFIELCKKANVTYQKLFEAKFAVPLQFLGEEGFNEYYGAAEDEQAMVVPGVTISPALDTGDKRILEFVREQRSRAEANIRVMRDHLSGRDELIQDKAIVLAVELLELLRFFRGRGEDIFASIPDDEVRSIENLAAQRDSIIVDNSQLSGDFPDDSPVFVPLRDPAEDSGVGDTHNLAGPTTVPDAVDKKAPTQIVDVKPKGFFSRLAAKWRRGSDSDKE